jgi:hypothetical protein
MTLHSARHPRRSVTTTHTPAGPNPGWGSPRLVLKLEQRWPGEAQPVYWCDEPFTTIGSSSFCDVVLPDIEPLHTVVIHDELDEYLVENCGPETRLHGVVVVESMTLRTGARIDLGPHSLSFFREEYADHGRPYGGREGGEFGHQRSQPPRPSDEEPSTGR